MGRMKIDLPKSGCHLKEEPYHYQLFLGICCICLPPWRWR